MTRDRRTRTGVARQRRIARSDDYALQRFRIFTVRSLKQNHAANSARMHSAKAWLRETRCKSMLLQKSGIN